MIILIEIWLYLIKKNVIPIGITPNGTTNYVHMSETTTPQSIARRTAQPKEIKSSANLFNMIQPP